MIGYATLGSNDLEKALAFYDALFAEMGASRVMEIRPTFHLYGKPGGTSMVAVCTPNNGEAQTVGNGNMLAIPCESEEQIQNLHKKAVELGGADEGEPGKRMDGFYGAYIRDLDGNKLCFYKLG